MKHLARIIKGKFVYTNPKKLESQLKRLDDTSVIVEVYKHIPKRSGALNQYYWKEEMHEVLKAKFLYKKEMIGLEWVKISRSTTDLGNKEFIDYIDKIKIFASMELSIYIPDPNEI